MSVLREVGYPVNWSSLRFGSIASRVSESGFGSLEPLSVFLGAGVVPRSEREDNHNQLGADMEKYQRVLPGDIVFNKLRTWQGGFGVSHYTGIVSPAYIIARPTPAVDSRFLHHFMRSAPVLAELTRLSKWMPPSQFDINWEDIRGIEIALPSLDEQRRIADFLDDQVARIDATRSLVATQRSLLAEHQRSLITAAVTGQLDLDTGKPRAGAHAGAGVSVLAQIEYPGTWDRVRFGSVASRVSESGFGSLEPLSVFLGAGVVPRAEREDNHNQLGADMDKYQRVLPGDLVFNKLRTWQGGFGVSDFTGIVSPAYIIARPTPAVFPRFLHHFMRSEPVLAELTRLSKWMPPSQFDIGWEDIRGVTLALPPVEEQRRIADFLDTQVARIHDADAALETMLARLEEYKRSLITAAVTGELDVTTARPGVSA